MNLKQIRFLLLAGLLCLLVGQISRAQEPEYDHDNWTFDRFPPVFAKVFPFEEGADVSFRVHGDYERDIIEYSFSFLKKPDQSIEVVVRRADTVPVFIQLMRLHLKNRGASAESFTKQLKIREWRLTDKTCPAVKTRFSRFEILWLPVSSETDREDEAMGRARIMLHPEVYDFEAQIWGGKINLGLWGPDDEHPLIVWMDETRRILDRCLPGNALKANH
jgi:hypothetical protein